MSKKILIVEDDQFTRQFYAYLFNKTDYSIFQTEDFDEIISTLTHHEISLIILDVNLKNTFHNGDRIDGVFLSKYLKQNKDYSTIPIMLVTANQNNLGGRNYFEESLADDYIVKPVTDYNELINKVNNLTLK